MKKQYIIISLVVLVMGILLSFVPVATKSVWDSSSPWRFSPYIQTYHQAGAKDAKCSVTGDEIIAIYSGFPFMFKMVVDDPCSGARSVGYYPVSVIANTIIIGLVAVSAIKLNRRYGIKR